MVSACLLLPSRSARSTRSPSPRVLTPHDSQGLAYLSIRKDAPCQGLKVAAPQEIVWRNGWITDAQLEALAQPLAKSGYGQYLLRLLKEKSLP